MAGASPRASGGHHEVEIDHRRSEFGHQLTTTPGRLDVIATLDVATPSLLGHAPGCSYAALQTSFLAKNGRVRFCHDRNLAWPLHPRRRRFGGRIRSRVRSVLSAP